MPESSAARALEAPLGLIFGNADSVRSLPLNIERNVTETAAILRSSLPIQRSLTCRPIMLLRRDLYNQLADDGIADVDRVGMSFPGSATGSGPFKVQRTAIIIRDDGSSNELPVNR
jgi:hypothetical protein